MLYPLSYGRKQPANIITRKTSQNPPDTLRNVKRIALIAALLAMHISPAAAVDIPVVCADRISFELRTSNVIDGCLESEVSLGEAPIANSLTAPKKLNKTLEWRFKAAQAAAKLDGVSLSRDGLKQREAFNSRAVASKFDQVISSPIQRCLETIEGAFQEPLIADEFQEVHYGDWTGKKMSSLMRNAAWREIHKNPASVRFPNGETLPEVQTRALLGIDKFLHNKSKNILISTHADVVKVLILHALGTHLNNIDKVSIDNASISIIDRTKEGLRVIKVNDTSANVKDFLI